MAAEWELWRGNIDAEVAQTSRSDVITGFQEGVAGVALFPSVV
jgi:hypothetical protein